MSINSIYFCLELANICEMMIGSAPIVEFKGVFMAGNKFDFNTDRFSESFLPSKAYEWENGCPPSKDVSAVSLAYVWCRGLFTPYGKSLSTEQLRRGQSSVDDRSFIVKAAHVGLDFGYHLLGVLIEPVDLMVETFVNVNASMLYLFGSCHSSDDEHSDDEHSDDEHSDDDNDVSFIVNAAACITAGLASLLVFAVKLLYMLACIPTRALGTIVDAVSGCCDDEQETSQSHKFQ